MLGSERLNPYSLGLQKLQEHSIFPSLSLLPPLSRSSRSRQPNELSKSHAVCHR
jgi:hypothetical protein